MPFVFRLMLWLNAAAFMLKIAQAQTITPNGAGLITPSTYARLGVATPNTVKFCRDCTATLVCAAGGSGAFAKRTPSGWDCSFAAGNAFSLSQGFGVVLVELEGTITVEVDDTLLGVLTAPQDWSARQAFNAGVGLSTGAADLVGPVDGDVWYNPTTHKFRGQENGVVKDVIAAAAGGSSTLTAGSCFLTSNCAPPLAGLAAVTPAAVVNRVYVVQVVPPVGIGGSATWAVRAGGGGTVSDSLVLGAYDNAPGNVPGNLLGSCVVTNVTSGGAWRTCAAALSLAIPGGAPSWFALSATAAAMVVRGYPGGGSNAFTEFVSLATPSRIGYCTPAMSGTTLPASCTGFVSESWPVPMVLVTP